MSASLAPFVDGADDNYDFEALYSSIEASIDRKKEETREVREAVNVLSQQVSELNSRAGILGRRVERERQERSQETSSLSQALANETKALEKILEQEQATRPADQHASRGWQSAQAEREAAAQHLFAEEKQAMEQRMDEQRKYLESAIAYVRTSVEQEKMMRSGSEQKLLQALQEVSVSVQISMTQQPVQPQVKIFKDLEARVNALDRAQSEQAGRKVNMLLLPEGARCLEPGPGTGFTEPAPGWQRR